MRASADVITTASNRSSTIASCRNVRWCSRDSPRVLRIRETRRGGDQLDTSEQIAQLDDDEHEEQQIDEAERRRDRNDAERQPRVAIGERVCWSRAEQRAAQISSGEGREDPEQCDVPQYGAEVDP